ncbi:3-oxoacyl-ACP reductase FabG [Nocardioides carbamazepini]|uniref:3-oxoacyl-ACP reductase FabG n=1 Tax=Nocardioides carbamazepini TaxID=2854259 RepID=UPI00214A0C7B|nr:3-oxoacyl-ACP reductase FabG [Nocardioides carbamazepini]MCR1785554.1 3-oxoacyl-ACP reductase FabG [Nocardioides carbamazepini]
MVESWQDVRVLVTGGSQGIGVGIARAFATAGAQVVVTGRSAERLAAACERLAGEGAAVTGLVADVARRDGCHRMVAEAAELLGGLDVLCANAGVYPEQRIEDLTEEFVDEVLDTNLKGTIFAVQAAVPHLVASGRGRVVVTTSITGPTTGYPGLAVYAASKAAQLGFVRTAALELAPHGITVNAVSPGAIRTEGLAGLGEEAIDAMTRVIPAGRLGEPDDIGAAALYLAGLGASFVTGQELVVDGGQVLPEHPDAVSA